MYINFNTRILLVQINANYIEYSPAVLLSLTAIYYWGLGENPDNKYKTQQPFDYLTPIIHLSENDV